MIQKQNCLFCEIVNKNQTSFKIYEDDLFLVFLDIYPKSLGHTLVIPKNHSNNFTLMEKNELEKINLVIQKIEKALYKTLNHDGCFIRTNVNAIAGQVIFHTHFHIVPQYERKIDIVVTQELASKISKNIC